MLFIVRRWCGITSSLSESARSSRSDIGMSSSSESEWEELSWSFSPAEESLSDSSRAAKSILWDVSTYAQNRIKSNG